VVGCFDNTVRVLSLDNTQPMAQLTLQALAAQPSSLLLTSMTGVSKRESGANLYLFIGLQTGVMMRSKLDDANGSLTDSRKRFLGTKPVKLCQVQVQGKNAVLALSSRSWLSYTYQYRFYMTPLTVEQLEHSSSFSSEQCPEGLVCIAGSTLKIMTLERLGELFNQKSYPLRYTPRKFIIHPVTNHLIILESDNNTYSEKEKKVLNSALAELTADEMDEEKDEKAIKVKKEENGDDETKDSKQEKDEKDEKKEEKKGPPPESFVGSPQAGLGRWASCIRIVDPLTGETVFLEDLEENEAAFSLTTVQFKADGEVF